MALKFVTVTEAAGIVGVSPARIRVFIDEGRLKAEEAGGMYLIPKEEVQRFCLIPRRTGKPPEKIRKS